MAEKREEDGDNAAQSNVSSWWGSFYDSAKQKLAETNEFLVRDMKEFTDTVRTDTSKLVANTAASMKDQLNIKVNLDEASNATKLVTSSISGFLGKVVQHVTPIPPDDGENEDSTMFLGTSSGVKVMTPAEARLFSLQTSPTTFCTEPDNSAEFDLWRETFHLDERKEELSLLMLDSKEVRSLYTKLVPEAVSHVDFWTRYFYKKRQLEKAEERRAKLVERAQAADTSLDWDDEDDLDQAPTPETKDAVFSDLLPPKSLEKASPVAPFSTETVSSTTVAPSFHENTEERTMESSSKDVVETAVTDAANLLPEETVIVDLQESSNPLHAELTQSCDNRPSNVPAPSEPNSPTPRIEESTSSTKTLEVAAPDLQSPSQPLSELQSSPQPPTELHPVPQVPADQRPIPRAQTRSPSSENKCSAPSPKAVESSSGADSSEWEKEFDLDMTEDEIIEALQEEDNEDDIEGWEEWE